MKKRYKASTILIAAALAVLMAGAALAAGLGLIGEINRLGRIQLLPGAEPLVESNLGALSTEYIDLTVEEAVWDGRSAFVQARLTLKHPEEYALLPAEYVYEERESGEFIFSEEGRDFTGVKGEFLGHRDGKSVVRYTVAMSTPDMSLGYWDARRNEDGSVTLWMEGDAGYERRRDTSELTISLGWGVHGEFTRDDAPLSWNWELRPWLPGSESMRVTVNNAAQKTKVKLEAGESEQGIIRFLGGEATFTPLKGYYKLSYLMTKDELKDSFLVARFMDMEGNEIESTNGHGGLNYDRTLDLWKYDWEGDMQSYDPIPESIYFALIDVENDKQVIDRVEIKLVPAE